MNVHPGQEQRPVIDVARGNRGHGKTPVLSPGSRIREVGRHVFPIRVPPLGERREDIPLLVEHFVSKCAVRLNQSITGIPPRTMELLMQWAWPGNIRELEN